MALAPEQAGAPTEDPITSASPTMRNSLVFAETEPELLNLVGQGLAALPALAGPGQSPGACSFRVSGGTRLCDSEVAPWASCRLGAGKTGKPEAGGTEVGVGPGGHMSLPEPVPALSELRVGGGWQGTVPLWAEGPRKAGSKYTVEAEGSSPSAQKLLQLPVPVCAPLDGWACIG